MRALEFITGHMIYNLAYTTQVMTNSIFKQLVLISLFFSFKFRFTVPEEEEPGYFVGKVEANDPDEGKNGRVFYYIIDGNVEKWFSVDKTYGNIYTKKRLDREERDHYMIQVKTTNNPDLVHAHHMFSRILKLRILNCS